MIIASNMGRGTEKLVRRNSRVNGEVLYGKEQNFRERKFFKFLPNRGKFPQSPPLGEILL